MSTDNRVNKALVIADHQSFFTTDGDACIALAFAKMTTAAAVTRTAGAAPLGAQTANAQSGSATASATASKSQAAHATLICVCGSNESTEVVIQASTHGTRSEDCVEVHVGLGESTEDPGTFSNAAIFNGRGYAASGISLADGTFFGRRAGRHAAPKR